MEETEETRDDKLLKMTHTRARKFKSHPRLKPALWHWWQAKKTYMHAHHYITCRPINCLAPHVAGSVLKLVGPVSVYCDYTLRDWVRA